MAPWEADPTITNSIALLGSAAVIMLWLAPVRDVFTSRQSIWATKSTASIATAFGYVAGMFNCILWNMYAVTRLDKMTVPFLVNTVGLFLNLSFVACYYTFATGKPKTDTRNQIAILTVLWILAVFIWIATGSNDIVGYIAAFVNVLMFFGPLAAAGQVIRSKSTRGMPFPPLVFTLIASALWFIYGLYILEVPVMIPNGLGVFFGIAQISLWLWARSYEKQAPVSGEGASFVPIGESDDQSTSSMSILRDEEAASIGLVSAQ